MNLLQNYFALLARVNQLYFDSLVKKFSDKNIVDLLWQAEQNSSVVDSFKPNAAYAAENTVDTAITNATAEFAPSPSMVFTTDQIGYIFFIDAANDLKYSKTTNGGTNWGAAVTIDATITGW